MEDVAMRRIKFIGKTKDGNYAADKEVEMNPDGNTLFTVPNVITENGYVDLTIKLDQDGRLLAVQVERTNIGL